MFNMDKQIIINNLVSILRILRTIRYLRDLPICQIIRKCVFMLGNCSLHNIALLYRRGIFREKLFLQMIGELLILRKVADVRIVGDLMREFACLKGVF